MEMKSNKIRSDWIYFFTFLTVNFLLAYSSFPIIWKLWLGLMGLLFPFGLFFNQNPNPSDIPLTQTLKEELFPKNIYWLLFLLIPFALFGRFYKLTTLSTWPNPDESLSAWVAFHISNYWDWKFFYTYSQACFPFFWLWALVIKISGLSLWTLWLFPALLSSVSLPLFYLASRSFFSKSFSFIFAAFGGLAFWGMYSGRVGTCAVLLPSLELLTFYFLGQCTNPLSGKTFYHAAIGLALTLAFGFYVYPPAWLPLTTLYVLAFVNLAPKNGHKFFNPLLLFGFVFILALIPFVISALRENYGSYIRDIQPNAYSLLNLNQILVGLSYLTGLFWGKMGGDYYGPYWGGLFDPLTTSLFLIGAQEIWRSRGNSKMQWVFLAFVFTLLPGILSSNLEYFRIFLIFPIILFLACLGFHRLGSDFKIQSRFIFLILILAVMASLNLYHLLGPYQHHWKQPGPEWSFYKTPENYRAYNILSKKTQIERAGYIFQNFSCDMHDPSLSVAIYPFNQADNPSLAQSSPKWFAVLANENYRPFLLRRFPEGQWYGLSMGLNREDGGLGLGIFPVRSIPNPTLKKWLLANKGFEEVAYSFLNRPTGTDYQRILVTLGQLHPLMQGDPFLESSFWEKTYYLYLQNGSFGDKKKEENFNSAFLALQKALAQGYRPAHLLNEYGTYQMMTGHYSEALLAFQKAIQANPAFDPAQENLKILLSSKGRKTDNP